MDCSSSALSCGRRTGISNLQGQRAIDLRLCGTLDPAAGLSSTGRRSASSRRQSLRPREPVSTLATHLELTKPRITALVVFTTATGLWLAPARPTATGRCKLPGLLLFTVLFPWQVPHFLATTLFRRREFARAGLIVQPNEPAGEREARRNIVLYTVALIAVSLMFIPVGLGGMVYLVAAAGSGALFLAHGIQGLRTDSVERWARIEFLGSLAYLTVLLAVLLLDRPHAL